jgi:hypothetical protein
MSFGTYGILIIFGAFDLLLIFNPNLSCFGRKIRSPFYPLFRKKSRDQRKKIVTEDFGFDLKERDAQSGIREAASPNKKMQEGDG